MTWADLKLAVVTSLNRDDLTDAAIATLQSTIRRLQRDFFDVTPVTGYIQTVIGQAIYPSAIASLSATLLPAAPMDLVRIDTIRMDYANTWRVLVGPVEYDYMLYSDVNIPATLSVPTSWAIRDAIFRIYPAPIAVYTFELTGNAKIPIPETDETENFWTQNCFDVVHFMTLAQLYATRIKDPDSAQRCFAVAEQHRISLVREAQEKSVRGVFSAWW